MRGFFGGELEDLDGTSLERVPEEIAQALAEAPLRGPLPPLLEPAAKLHLVALHLQTDGTLRADRSLADAPPLGALASQRTPSLEALALAAAAVAALHAADACHGELGPDAIRVLDEGRDVLLLVPAARPPAGALLRARLRAGALPAITAFSAPEVVTGYEATPASDVYTLCALAHEIITGRAPLGQVDFSDATQGPFAHLAQLIHRGLAASPEVRPRAEALAAALREATGAARQLEQSTQAGPYRGSPAGKAPAPRAQSPAEASAQKAQASSMSGILLTLLMVGGLFVFTGALWLVSVTWSALDGAGRSFLLLALTGGVLAAGASLGKKGYAGSGRALLVLGVELLWADGAYLLDQAGSLGGAGAWSALAAVMTVIAFGLAGALDSLIFAGLAALHLAIFAGILGVYLHTGAPTGPSVYLLAVTLLASALAYVGHGWRRERMGIPFAVLATCAALGSGLVSLGLLDRGEHAAFGTAWPYFIAAVAVAAALAPIGRYAGFGAAVAGILLAVAPTAEALLCDSLGYLLGAVALGFGVLGAAFTWARLRRDASAQGAWVVVGLASVVTGPSLRFLGKCWDQDGLDALKGPSGVYLTLVLVLAAALVWLSFVVRSRARDKATYRLLELAALSMFFGTFTLQSVVRYHDAFYPLVILAASAVCLAVGATTKHATLVVLASAALLLNLAIQYFAKLASVMPASLLTLVFGLLLLAGGVLYERRLKHLLPGLREWS